MQPAISPALADAGLVLQAAIPVARFDDELLGALTDAAVDANRFRTLLMFGQGGRRLFEQHVAHDLDRPDPVDETSVELVTRWIETAFPGARFEIVYPGPGLLPLGRLAEEVGWGRASPLGLTINSQFGLWVAHRVAVIIDVDVAAPPAESEHPCESCADTPCVGACPVGAVSLSDSFDLEACSYHRIEDESACAYQCLARNACPVGADHRYGPEQMRHHYGAGLASIRRWLEPETRPPGLRG